MTSDEKAWKAFAHGLAVKIGAGIPVVLIFYSVIYAPLVLLAIYAWILFNNPVGSAQADDLDWVAPFIRRWLPEAVLTVGLLLFVALFVDYLGRWLCRNAPLKDRRLVDVSILLQTISFLMVGAVFVAIVFPLGRPIDVRNQPPAWMAICGIGACLLQVPAALTFTRYLRQVAIHTDREDLRNLAQGLTRQILLGSGAMSISVSVGPLVAGLSMLIVFIFGCPCLWGMGAFLLAPILMLIYVLTALATTSVLSYVFGVLFYRYFALLKALRHVAYQMSVPSPDLFLAERVHETRR